MFESVLVLAVGSVLASGGGERPSETQELVEVPFIDFLEQGPALGPHPDPWLSMIGLSGSSGSFRSWSLVVPAGKSKLTFKSSGGTGDADLYVNFGAVPTTTTYQCRPNLSGNDETCTLTAPSAGKYYVGLRANSAYADVTLTTTVTAGP